MPSTADNVERSSSGLKFYIAIEKFNKSAYRACSLPPLEIDEIGSVRGQLIDRVRAKIASRFGKLTPRRWTRPIPGNDRSLDSPTIIILQVEFRVKSLNESHTIPVDIHVVRWQVDEKNYAYFAPALGRTWIGKETYWESGPLVLECREEIEKKLAATDLDFVRNWLVNRELSLHIVSFTAEEIAKPFRSKKEKLQKLDNLKKTSSRVDRWKLGEVYERELLVDQVAEILLAEQPQSVLLVGEPGVGKTAIVQRLPKHNANFSRLWSTSGSRLVAGLCGWGMWQEQLEKILEELKQIKGFLHVGSLAELVESGKYHDEPGVASFLKPEMQRGRVRLIAECTPQVYQRLESEDPALIRCFHRVDVDELPIDANQRLLQKAAEELLAERRLELRTMGYQAEIALDPAAIVNLDLLCRRYCGYSAMPTVPLRFLRRAISGLPAGETLSTGLMNQTFSHHTGMPNYLIDDHVPLDYDLLRQRLAERVIGQEEPVEAVANMVVTLKTRLQRPEKPLASFLFIGPTGVGKTEMAKALAEVFFGDSGRMVRLDMSEYATAGSLGRLTGLRNMESGTLTGPILDQPFSLILLDEIEKAHPSVFDLLLQVLGEGRLTDTKGRRADFRSAAIIMTSNLGVDTFRTNGTGFAESNNHSYREHFEREVQRYVRPELLGRLDRIIPFVPLPQAHVRQIAKRELEKIWKRPGILYGNFDIQVSEDVIDWLSERGYQPQYGARPLRRVIEEFVSFPLSKFLADDASTLEHSKTIRTIEIKKESEGITIREVAQRTKSLESSERQSKDFIKVYPEQLDAWRILKHKAMLVQASSERRQWNEILERQNRQLKEIAIRIQKLRKSEHQVDAIADEGRALSDKKKTTTIIEAVDRTVDEIKHRYQRILRAFLNGEKTDPAILELSKLENDLKISFLDMDLNTTRKSQWTMFYLDKHLHEFRFLIDAHVERFRGEGAIYLLYDYNKYEKLKKESFFNTIDEADIMKWKLEKLVAIKKSEPLWSHDLKFVSGMAIEMSPTRLDLKFIEEERGVHHLKIKKPSGFSKTEMKVHVLPQTIKEIHKNLIEIEERMKKFEAKGPKEDTSTAEEEEMNDLRNAQVNIEFESGLNPIREYLPDSYRMNHLPLDLSIQLSSSSGSDLKAAVSRLLDEIQDASIWSQLGVRPIPPRSLATSPLFY